MKRLLKELKRRNVYRVGVTYAVIGFVVIQKVAGTSRAARDRNRGEEE